MIDTAWEVPLIWRYAPKTGRASLTMGNLPRRNKKRPEGRFFCLMPDVTIT